MFYSHEVLTSRKHGVATVWLVATLGSKSTLKKVNRKELCAVDIPKACQTVVSPEAPMALRLQSNLLYGITRVFGEQCNFVLQDARTEQHKLRLLINSINAATTDVEGKHKAKHNQITLPDDPDFFPELAWDSDFDPFRDDPDSTDLEGSSQLSSLLNPNLPMSSALGSEHFIHPGDEIIVPPSASSYSAGRAGFGFSGRGSVISEDANKAYNQSVHGAQEERLLDHPGFEFDADGNWVEGMQEPEMVRASSIQDSAPVMRDHIQPRSDNHYDFQFDDLPTINQDDVDMNNVEAFPIRQQAEEEEEEEEISSTVAASRVALNRHSRKKKVLPLDQQTSLRNSDLQDWDRNYLYNQTAALEQKSKGTSLAQARRNADFSVLRNFGGLGVVFWGMENYAPEELAFYTSPEFIESLRCPILSPAGKKRGHEDEQEDQARNVRQKMDDFGSEDLVENANDFGQTFDSIEVGREAETPLADIMSSTPWLVSGVASRAPSSRLVSVPFSPAPVPGPAILAVESQDFLSFVHAGVAQIRADAETTVEAVASVLDVDDDDGENDDNLAVEFGALLDPAVTTKSAAAQGFLQLLGLAQRKLLQVEQVEDFGEIEVRVL